MTPRARIFLLDDDELVVSTLSRALKGEGYEVQSRCDPAGAVEAMLVFAPDLVLLDLKLPGTTGLDILRELTERGNSAQVVMLSSDGSADSAVRAMKMGAVNYLTKPFDLDEMKLMVASIVENGQLRQEVEYLRHVRGDAPGQRQLVGTSASVVALRQAVEKLARARVPNVLITGENGTGKELVARHLHEVMHPSEVGRRCQPFIAINCAALPEHLIESELFGHEKGAFTDAKVEKKGIFELACAGTILLDEIGEMKWNLQAKLLRVLEDRTIRRVGGRHDIPVKATVLAATNRDLEQAIQRGEFRVDLFYRLATFSVHLTPLRDRPEDLLPLARHFLTSFASKYGHAVPERFSPEAARLLRAYAWPGNIRELRNVMERIAVLGSGEEVLPEHLPKEILRISNATPAPPPAVGNVFLLPEAGLSLDELERSLIEQALARCGGNKAHAAKLLGMTYDSLRYQIKKFSLDSAG